MAVLQDDLSGITTHNIDTSFSNLVIGSRYMVSLEINSPYLGMHKLDRYSIEFTASSDSIIIPIILTKNISVKIMFLELFINNLDFNIKSSSKILIRCSSFNTCGSIEAP